MAITAVAITPTTVSVANHLLTTLEHCTLQYKKLHTQLLNILILPTLREISG